MLKIYVAQDEKGGNFCLSFCCEKLLWKKNLRIFLSVNIHYLVIFQIERLISNWEHQKIWSASTFLNKHIAWAAVLLHCPRRLFHVFLESMMIRKGNCGWRWEIIFCLTSFLQIRSCQRWLSYTLWRTRKGNCWIETTNRRAYYLGRGGSVFEGWDRCTQVNCVPLALF